MLCSSVMSLQSLCLLHPSLSFTLVLVYLPSPCTVSCFHILLSNIQFSVYAFIEFNFCSCLFLSPPVSFRLFELNECLNVCLVVFLIVWLAVGANENFEHIWQLVWMNDWRLLAVWMALWGFVCLSEWLSVCPIVCRDCLSVCQTIKTYNQTVCLPV